VCDVGHQVPALSILRLQPVGHLVEGVSDGSQRRRSALGDAHREV